MDDQDTGGSEGSEESRDGVLISDRTGGGGKGVLVGDGVLISDAPLMSDGVLVGDRSGVLISDRSGVLISDAPIAGAPVVPDLFF